MALTVFMALPNGLAGADSFVCDATVSLAPTFSNTITSHPIEKGAVISDHTYSQNPKISIQGVVSGSYSGEDYSNNPGLTFERNLIGYNQDRVTQAYNLLKELYEARTPFSVIAEHDIYNNCIVRQFSTDFKQDTSAALIFTLVVEQVRLVDLQKVDITFLAEAIKDDAGNTVAGNGVKEEVEKGPIFSKTLEAVKREAIGIVSTGAGGSS